MFSRFKSTLTPPVVPEQPAAKLAQSLPTLTEPTPIPLPDIPDFEIPRSGMPLARKFCQLGFTAIAEAFTTQEVANLRNAAIERLPPNSYPYQPQSSAKLLFEPAFRSIFLNAKFISGLRAVLGEDFIFMNELAIQDSSFAGWHTDVSSPDGKAGHNFHWSPTFMVANIAIYLQDNLNNGGGLDVVPGSYVVDDPVAKAIRRTNGFDISEFDEADEGDPYSKAVTLRKMAGDVVRLHLRD